MWSPTAVEAEEPSPVKVQKSDWGNPDVESGWGSMEWGDRDDGGDEGSVRRGPTPIVSASCFPQ